MVGWASVEALVKFAMLNREFGTTRMSNRITVTILKATSLAGRDE